MYIIFVVILLLFGLFNYYAGVRLSPLFQLTNIRHTFAYWSIIAVLASGFLVGRRIEDYWTNIASAVYVWIGAYWLAALYYLVLMFFLVDLIRFVAVRIQLPESVISSFSYFAPRVVAVAVLVLLVAGTWNAWSTVVSHYNIGLAKKAGEIREIKAVMVSDIHLGTIVNDWRLKKAVDIINGFNPDIVFLPGDIIDHRLGALEEESLVEIFGQINNNYGIYAVLGNHEYISNYVKDINTFYDKAGIILLKDSYVLVADSFYIVGRDEYSKRRFTGEPRKQLSEIMDGIDLNRPVILMDHQPVQMDIAEQAGVDLMLSGHSHRGQLAPINLITKKIYEIDWGYLQKERLQVIVSSGYGTWGPPIRIGSRSEIICFTISFDQSPGS